MFDIIHSVKCKRKKKKKKRPEMLLSDEWLHILYVCYLKKKKIDFYASFPLNLLTKRRTHPLILPLVGPPPLVGQSDNGSWIGDKIGASLNFGAARGQNGVNDKAVSSLASSLASLDLPLNDDDDDGEEEREEEEDGDGWRRKMEEWNRDNSSADREEEEEKMMPNQ